MVDDKSMMPSLQLLIAERAFKTQAKVTGHQLRWGSTLFDLDNEGRIACNSLPLSQPTVIPLRDFLNRTLPLDFLKHKRLVVGYGRSDALLMQISPTRKMSAHEIFYPQTRCLIESLNWIT